MTSRQRPAPALDTGQFDDPPEENAAVLAETAEAEAAAAEAEARAAAARARAIRLQRQAAEVNPLGRSDGADVEDRDDVAVDVPAASPAPSTTPPRYRKGRKVVGVGAAIMLIVASLAGSGYMMWHHRAVSQEQHRTAEFAEAARQAVTTVMSLDFNKTGDNMKRIAETSTGQFKEHFPMIVDELAKRLQQSQVVTTTTVNDVAVERMDDNSAIVLVAATTDAMNHDEGPQEPQPWHIALGLTMDGGQPKMSSIEFVQ
jgi:Mce-associated membrane protein